VQISEIILNDKIFYSFLRYSLFISFARAKETNQRKHADCTSAAKNQGLLPKRRKTSPSGSLRCGAFNGKNP
jgi:hypothetical protein